MNKYQKILNQLVKHDIYRNFEDNYISFYYSRKVWRHSLEYMVADYGFMKCMRKCQINEEI